MPLPIQLYNTLTRTVEPLTPITPGVVKIYCCGPTVYNYQHIGNLRTYLFEDLLVRTLRYAGYKVNHVMNITDVGHLVGDGDMGDDKMAVAMRREKKSSMEIAEYYTKIFFDDCAELNITRPDNVCAATQHITEMIELIKRLESRGMIYVAGGNVYFDTSKLADYGKLAKLDISKLNTRARVESDANKRNPLDFVLWFTKSKFEGQELQWDSPWGRGYPGWHIECSAMSMKYLGDEFDIHCGGIDHISVHHTNEIAQSEGATGKLWVRHWMHGEFLLTGGEKMAKSQGNFLHLGELKARGFEPLAYRFFCLGAHYKFQLSYTDEAMHGASNAFAKLKANVVRLKAESAGKIGEAAGSAIAEFQSSILNDLNTPQALATVWSVLSDAELSAENKLATLLEIDQVLGLGMAKWQEQSVEIPANVQALVDARAQARANKLWADSDRLRDEIKALGFIVEDSGGKQKVRKA